MSFDLSDTLVVGISATALFDLSEADQFFRKQLQEDPDTAIEKYRDYMLKEEEVDLNAGTGMPLVKALLDLNKYKENSSASPLTEVVILSRNSPETAVRVLNNIRRKGLNISRSAFTGGETVVSYLEAFDVDLFLTTNLKDAQIVADNGYCACAILNDPPKISSEPIENQVRIAFDGDAVLFNEDSELLFKTSGLNEFHKAEDRDQNIPLPEGPYATFLRKLSRLQDRLPFRVEYSPVRIALVTARNAPAEMRVIKTLREWGVYVDEVFFLGGVEKANVIKAFKAHIFFDDQQRHLEITSKFIPSGLVPYKSTSPLSNLNLPKINLQKD
ncbi:5'-nucleotidase [Leptospira adleri]|uniref:5'-nucleotidase n=1 Tax=Leptospira adleri TaxID=2023186 RepID=UPI001083A77C|nr:5'-nucleotidase [Leptospira adleri]TGM58543.1 5'-nucleotidase [Leptospira adleri]